MKLRRTKRKRRGNNKNKTVTHRETKKGPQGRGRINLRRNSSKNTT